MKIKKTWQLLIAPLLLLLAGLIFVYYSEKIAALGDLPEVIDLALAVFSYFASAWIVSRVIGVLIIEARRGKKRPYPKLLTDLISAILYVVAFCASIALSMGQGAVGAFASSGLIIAVLGFLFVMLWRIHWPGSRLALKGRFGSAIGCLLMSTSAAKLLKSAGALRVC